MKNQKIGENTAAKRNTEAILFETTVPSTVFSSRIELPKIILVIKTTGVNRRPVTKPTGLYPKGIKIMGVKNPITPPFNQYLFFI
ncbi:MAG: hypothetical protein ABI430_00970 [Candidatus Taylorbacteria bacterium]